MADSTSDEDIQAALADPSTPAPLRAAYEALRGDLETERANRLGIERRAVFAEAGLSDHPARELLERAYEDGMTAQALKETAAKYGLLSDGAASTPTPENRDDLDALRRVGQAASSTPPAAGLTFDEAISRARSVAEWDHIMRTRGAEAGVELSRVSSRGHRLV